MGHGHAGIREPHTARIWVDLPVLVEGHAAEHDGQEHGNPCREDETEADVDPCLELESVLLPMLVDGFGGG